MKKKILNIVPIVIALLLAVGVSTVFKGCGPKEDGSWMHCHTAQLHVFRLSLVVALLGLVDFLLKNRVAKLVLGGAAIVLSVVTVLIPGILVPLCMMETMHCQAVMKPFVSVVGVLLVVFGVVKEVVLIRSKEVENEENYQEAFN